MSQNLKKQAADLERRVKQRAETVKKVLREYRETVRASAGTAKGTSPRTRDKARVQKKRLDVERANAEYMQLQKELDHLRSRMQARK